MVEKSGIIHMVKEFMRYCVVGGTAFLLDFFTLVFLREMILVPLGMEIVTATTIGIVVGFTIASTYNYILALKYVFVQQDQQEKGKGLVPYLVTMAVGIAGLVLTWVLMFVGENIFYVDYRLCKVFATGVVLIWNYLARRYFVFR